MQSEAQERLGYTTVSVSNFFVKHKNKRAYLLYLFVFLCYSIYILDMWFLKLHYVVFIIFTWMNGGVFMKFKLKDPGSAITHGIALLLAAVGAVPLIIKAARSYDVLHIVALSIFILTMVLLYAASTIYHSVDSTEKVNRRLRKMDHMMIFVMIAGSYTPVCLIVLHNRIGYILCALVWSIAVLGIILKGCWITCPKWLSSVLYIAMGWLCVLAFVPIFHALPRAGFDWLLAGGIIYTIGGVIYALKVPLFNSRHKNFGSHEIFHIFVMLGSACHFIVMYFFVAPLPV